MPAIFHRSKKQGKHRDKPFSTDRSSSPEAAEPHNLHLRPNSEKGLWQQAWDQVKTEVDWKLPASLQNPEKLSTKTEVEAIKEEAEIRRDTQEQNERKILGSKYTYREVCDIVSKHAQTFQFVGDMVTQAEPVYAALPWTAVRFIIGCAVGESETYHNILDGTEMISGLIVQYPSIEQVYAKIDSDTSRELHKSLLQLYKLILRFQLHAIRYFDPDRKIARAFAGLNPVKTEEVKSRLTSVEKAKQKVDSDIALVDAEVTKIGIDNLQEGQSGQREQLYAIKQTMKALAGETASAVGEQRRWMSEFDKKQQERNDVFIDLWGKPLHELKEQLENEKIQREKDNLFNVRRWLSRVEPETDYAEAKGKRHMTLGEWLIEHRKYKQWCHSTTSSFLWLHGFAGTGKTGLVCRVVDHIRTMLGKTEASDEHARLAIFYCSSDKPSTGRDDVSRADPSEALRSIVSQVSTSKTGRSVASIVQEKYEAFGPDSNQHRALADSECVEILVAIATQFPVIIVLDAFDELLQHESPNLIQQLKEVVRQCPETINVFISTRSFPAIEDDLASNQSIEVTADNNGRDVKTFIQQTLQARIDDKTLLNGRISDELKSDIETILTKRAKNMFLYASLLLNQMSDKGRQDDEDSIRMKLETLPKDITAAYNQIMVEVHDEKNNSQRSCRIAQDTFKWLLYAQESLPHDALLDAVSPPDRNVHTAELLHACRTLVIRGSSGFEFAHYSVREHIGRMANYSPSQCHIVISMSCLEMLNTMLGHHQEVLYLQTSFGQYALLYWPLHYENISQADLNQHRSAINAVMRSFLIQGRSKINRYQDWFTHAERKVEQTKDTNYLVSKLDALRSAPLTPLFAATVFGVEDLVGKFGRELHELNKCNEHGQTALCLAIENNKLGVVKALLSSRFPAEVNLLNVRAVQQFEDWDDDHPPKVIIYASALQCASANGRLEIAQFLLSKGAHVDLVAGYFGSPLQAAALRGHLSIVELLLGHNAEPNSQGGFYGNALQAAAVAGHVDIINALLEHKPPALASTPGGRYGSALMAAVCSGSSDTVFALLEEKADPNLRSKAHGTPLEKAADLGWTGRDIVKDLLEFKATADLSPKGEQLHILHKAALYNMPELVNYCLDEGCKIDMIATDGGPHYDRRLAHWVHQMTPLACACAQGHVNIVRLLLKRGASIECDEDPCAVLWLAAHQGRAGVVKTLLNTFKRTHETGDRNFAAFLDHRPAVRSGQPLLYTASTSTSPETVQILLDSGHAKYESNWNNATPLMATATFGRPNIARCIVDYHKRGLIDACIDQRANNGRTALFEACDRNRLHVLECLLGVGASLTIPDEQNHTVLHAATRHDNIGILSALTRKASEQLGPKEFRDFLDMQAVSGQTALIRCAEENRLPHLKLLLDLGADYCIVGNLGNSPLHFACRGDRDELVIALLEKARTAEDMQRSLQHFLNLENVDGSNAIFEPVMSNKLSTVKVLLDHGVDYMIGKSDDVTPLHIACYRGYTEMVDLLLDHALHHLDVAQFKTFLNKRNKQGTTPILDSAQGGYRKSRLHLRPGLVTRLLDIGADFTIPKANNVSILHHACYVGDEEMVKLLLKRCASVLGPPQQQSFINHRNYTGKTAFLDSIDNRSGRPGLEIVRLLLENGIDMTIPRNGHVNALHMACFGGHGELVRILLEHASQKLDPPRFKDFINQRNHHGKTPLFDASDTNRPAIMEMLLNHGANYTIAKADDITPLHVACHKPYRDLVSRMLAHISRISDPASFKAFLDSQDQKGKTALLETAEMNRFNSMRSLLGHGAVSKDEMHPSNKFSPDVLARFVNQQSTTNRRTALHDASAKGHVEIVRLLLESGAELDVYDKEERPPLHLAIRKGHEDLAIHLVHHARKIADQDKFRQFLSAKKGTSMDSAWDMAKRRDMEKLAGMIEECERELSGLREQMRAR
ncbi:MAG: hypothetical protein LQ350_004384 [Teloschistes chrysophthalmus]|nr:MAG: hypothetical protein LQ350_004384 [Niorma chrysophthalma]